MTDGDDDGFEERPTPPGPIPVARPPTNSERHRHRQTYPHGVTPVVRMTDDERALAHKQYQSAAPEQRFDGEDTNPFDMLNPGRPRRRHGDSVDQLAAQLRREAPDPYALIAAMAFEVAKAKQDDRTGRKELDDKLEKFLDVQPGESKFNELERKVGLLFEMLDGTDKKPGLVKEVAELAPVRRGLRWLQASLVVVVIGAGTWLYARGGKETAIDMRIEQLRIDTSDIKDEVKHMRALLDRRGTP